MSKLINYFLDNSLIVNLLMVALFTFGIWGVVDINKTLFPKVDGTEVHVSTIYLGGEPRVVEEQITRKIETSIKGISGIESIKSTTTESFSHVVIKIDDSLSDFKKNEVVNVIRDSISRINNFPGKLEKRPIIEKISLSEFPVVTVGISSKEKNDYVRTRQVAKIIQKKIEMLNDVKKVSDNGIRKKEIRISVNPDEILKRDISFWDIAEKIKENYYFGNIASIEEANIEYPLVYLQKSPSLKELLSFPIFSGYAGGKTVLSDVGIVRFDFEKENVISKINGKKVISLEIYKKNDADTVKTVESIKLFVKQEQEKWDDIDFIIADDLGRYITSSYDVVKNNALTGLILVIIILTLFLNFRTSFWVAIGIPISVLGTIGVLNLLGYSLDVISMAAMILVLGILVDDAVVISESIHKEKEQEANRSVIESAKIALRKRSSPVIFSVLTTIIAFVPMFFLSGDDGKFLFVIPLVVILSLGISLIEGLFILPSHIAHSIKGINNKSRSNWFAKVENNIKKILNILTNYNKTVVIVFIFFSIVLIAVASYRLDAVVYPQEGAEEFAIYLKAKPESSLKETEAQINKIDEIILKSNIAEIESFSTKIGTFDTGIEQKNIGKIMVSLVPFSKRKRYAPAIISELRELISKNSKLESVVFSAEDIGPAETKSLFVEIIGDDEYRKIAASNIYKRLESIKGRTDLERSDSQKNDAYIIEFDGFELSRHALSVANVLEGINSTYEGLKLCQFQEQNDEIDLVIELDRKIKNKLEYLYNITITNRNGANIPLKQLIKIKRGQKDHVINHISGERAIVIGVNYDNINEELLRRDLNQIKNDAISHGIFVKYKGNLQEKNKSKESSLKTFLLAFMGIFFILVILFKSLFRPILVLVSVVFAILGVLLIFLIHGVPLSFPATLGVVGLCGVAVNDVIVLLDEFFRQLETEGKAKKEIVVQAVITRLRAITLTTLTTSSGLIPLAYGIGGKDPFNAPMALALGWGVFIATFLTVFVFPSILMLIPFEVGKKKG